MKHIIFTSDNSFYKVASTDEKKDKILFLNLNYLSKEISDANFLDVVFGIKTPVLTNGTMSFEELPTSLRETTFPAISDATAAQEKLTLAKDQMINQFKMIDEYDSNVDAKSMVSFLEGIDTSQKTSWAAGELAISYIYNLPGCPEIFIQEF